MISYFHFFRTLLLVDDFLNLTYANKEVMLQLENTTLSLSLANGEVWRDTSVTITPDYVGLYSTSAGYTTAETQLTISAITTITIGTSYPDLLQDFIIYNTPLNNNSAQPLASFLSQCYCSESFTLIGSGCKSNADGTISPRYGLLVSV